MFILHIETSTKICSIAMSKGGDLVASIDLTEGMNHTALLAPSIDSLFESISIKPKDLIAISVSSGPGSYTGLRVGSSTAKAMAYTLKIPILAVPTLTALAHAAFECHPQADLAMPMLDARRNEVYTSLLDREFNVIIPASALILEKNVLADLLPKGKVIICCGDGAEKVIDPDIEGFMKDQSIQCRAAHLILPAYDLFTRHEFSDPLHFVPFYLKPPNITQPRVQT